MGIKDFTKLVSLENVTLKDLKNQVLAVDASLEIYRASLGMESIKGLTDSSNRPTIHISVILSNIIQYHIHNIKTIWVFDFDPEKLKNLECHNPLKLQELEMRKQKREAASAKIKQLKQLDSDSDSDLFSSDSENDQKKIEKLEKQKEIQKQEKIAFTLQPWMINDIKLILNLLNIKWIEASRGIEAECLAAKLTHPEIAEADAVLSSDADSLLFGAAILIKKNPRTKKYNRMSLSKILDDLDVSQDQLIQIGIVLGTDMYKDKVKKLFYRIGPKSVVNKVKTGELKQKFKDPEVKKAFNHFKEGCKIDEIEWHNSEGNAFSDVKKVNLLIEWLVAEKNFNRERIKKQLSKIIKL